MKTGGRTISAFSIVAVLAGASLVLPSAAHALPKNSKVEVYQSGLNNPIDMAWVPGTKRVFFTEKSGAIRMIKGGKLRAKPCKTLPVDSAGERGALGLALHPKYKKNHKLYVYYTNASPLENRVARFVVSQDRCTKMKVIMSGIEASSSIHHGGQIEFMGGKLFVAVGENGSPARSQNTSDRSGKILRYNPDGSVPKGNPFGNAVWSYGHRNPFGLDHKPGTSKLFSSENGPNCDDELNNIRKGRNYGWGPDYGCGTNGVGPNPKAPAYRWSNVIAPTDVHWYTGRMKALRGTLYMGDYLNGRLYRFVMNAKDNKPSSVKVIHDAGGAIIDVSEGPNGWLYFLTQTAMHRITPK